LVLLLHGVFKRDRDERQPIEGEVFPLLHQLLLLLSAPLLCGCVCERESKSRGSERGRGVVAASSPPGVALLSVVAATAVDVADPRERDT